MGTSPSPHSQLAPGSPMQVARCWVCSGRCDFCELWSLWCCCSQHEVTGGHFPGVPGRIGGQGAGVILIQPHPKSEALEVFGLGEVGLL